MKNSRGPGRPALEPSPDMRRQAENLAQFGLTQRQIALILRIAEKTLRRHFRKELDRGAVLLEAQAGQTLVQAMRKGGKEGVTAAIFVMKTRAGWSEKSTVNVNMNDVDPSTLTDAELAHILQSERARGSRNAGAKGGPK